MSPQSKPRKKKQGKAPGRRPEQQSPYGALLESAAALRSESWLLADAWASELYATLWLADSGTDPLVEALQKMDDPAALTALRALAGVGSEESRSAAFAAAETVAARGVAEPSWYVAGTVPDFRDAFLVTNLLGDVEVIAITQERAGLGETVLFMRQPVLGATAIELFATPAEGTVALLEDMIASTPEAFRDEITPLSASDVYDRVWPDVVQFWEDGPDEEAEEGLMGEEDVRHPVQLIALADARVRRPGAQGVRDPRRQSGKDGRGRRGVPGLRRTESPDVEAARAFARDRRLRRGGTEPRPRRLRSGVVHRRADPERGRASCTCPTRIWLCCPRSCGRGPTSPWTPGICRATRRERCGTKNCPPCSPSSPRPTPIRSWWQSAMGSFAES